MMEQTAYATAPPVLYELSGVEKSCEGPAERITILKNMDLTVRAGESLAIVGASGSGKSTLLHLLGALDTPTAGKVLFEGKSLPDMTPVEKAHFRNKKLGFVFQFYNLVPDLTIRENIEVTAHLSANPLPIDDLLHSLGLYEHRAKFPRQVSGGQQQRCAIGRALVKNPGLLLCDEPTGALDYQTSKEILELMENVNRDYGCTVVIVTHNDAIRHMAHRVLRLRDGKLAEDTANVERMAARDLTW